MERRKFIIGAGALATGSAAAMGTGAVTTFTADRSANVAEVTTDSSGIISLSAGTGADDSVEMSDGTLSIDLSGTNGEGINLDSVYTIGDDLDQVRTDLEDVHTAFVVQNNDNVAHNISVDYTLDDRSWVDESDLNWHSDFGGSKITFRPFAQGNPWSDTNTDSQTVPDYHEGNPGGVDSAYFGPGEQVAFQIIVDTTGEDASVDDNLSGTLEISVTTPGPENSE
ncbi:hypothetical protein [Halorubrum aidingense]|uniref:hypothetical protein n=1 Tax=Halorubrum aidingense TaxID=368623 RepID=UPI001266FF85|nr:hypothetical protein [Halorubrum aidingense]